MTTNTVAETGYTLTGLGHPATIIIDRWGIAHIRAGSEADAFLVQGFNAARERLWQMDLWRKRGLGLLAGDFGPGYLAQDRATRLFLYQGDMNTEWSAYGPVDTKDIVTRFVNGINLWIELTEQRPELLAAEFVRFGTKPRRWEPADVVRIRSHARSNNILSEVARAHVMARSSADVDLARKALAPDHDVTASNIDLSAIPLNVLDVYKLAIAPVTFTKERVNSSLAGAWQWTKADEFGGIAMSEIEEGSNNWVVSGTRTGTGRPILANDPHRPYSLPALRYVVHLSAPGLNAIGAGEPCVPGISMGHNDTAAFGLTIFPMDQEDLYVYQTRPGQPDHYLYNGLWEAMRIKRESIPVKGHAPQEVTLKFTRHGPVIFEDRKHNRVYAVRTVWSEPGAAAYVAALNYLKSANVTQFVDAIGHWAAPPVNHVYADTHGDIAWTVAGKAPRREGWDGLLPVSGDGSREWQGFVRPDELPRKINPDEAYLATANELNAPDFPHLGREANERSRIDRIRQVLDAQQRHTLEQSMALQNDSTSMPARRLSSVLASLPLDGDAALARDLLLKWKCTIAEGEPAAALFEVWTTICLKPALLDAIAPEPALRSLLGPGDIETIIALVERPDQRLGQDPIAMRNRIVADTLAAAVGKCRELLGDDVSAWTWGKLHRCTFNHPGAVLLGGDDKVCRSVGPFPVDGSSSTPLYAGYKPDSFEVFHGASFRMVIDVGNWDNSCAINAPGQSGDAASPHYDDHAPLWAKGDYVPLLFTPDAVDAVAELVIVLNPQTLSAKPFAS